MRLTLFVLTFFVMACGPAFHLQRAIEKGAKVTTDTVFQDVITERTITDTVTRFQTVREIFGGDTITVETVRWKSRLRIDTLTKTIYQQVECKPDTLRIPVAVETTIEAGYSWWDVAKWCLVVGALCILFTMLLKK